MILQLFQSVLLKAISWALHIMLSNVLKWNRGVSNEYPPPSNRRNRRNLHDCVELYIYILFVVICCYLLLLLLRWEVGGGRYVCVPFVPKYKVLDLLNRSYTLPPSPALTKTNLPPPTSHLIVVLVLVFVC